MLYVVVYVFRIVKFSFFVFAFVVVLRIACRVFIVFILSFVSVIMVLIVNGYFMSIFLYVIIVV